MENRANRDDLAAISEGLDAFIFFFLNHCIQEISLRYFHRA